MKINALFLLIIFLADVSFSKPSLSKFDNEIRNFIKNIFEDNDDHIKNISQEHFKSFLEQQTPRATVVSCSDSRVQTDAFHKNPINDLFFIRNIGNQLKTAEGSVEYGIDHLHTKILLIIGHTNCGAIKAALDDYSEETQAIRKELDNLKLGQGKSLNQAVVDNINNQVGFALKKFNNKILNNQLIVIGVIYDFMDDLKKGHGGLSLVNLNGETDPSKIKNSNFINGLKNISIGY